MASDLDSYLHQNGLVAEMYSRSQSPVAIFGSSDKNTLARLTENPSAASTKPVVSSAISPVAPHAAASAVPLAGNVSVAKRSAASTISTISYSSCQPMLIASLPLGNSLAASQVSEVWVGQQKMHSGSASGSCSNVLSNTDLATSHCAPSLSYGSLHASDYSPTEETKYVNSTGKTKYVNSTGTIGSSQLQTWSTGEISNRGNVFGEAIVDKLPNAVTTVTIGKYLSDKQTALTLPDQNVTQISSVNKLPYGIPEKSHTMSHNRGVIETTSVDGLSVESVVHTQSVHVHYSQLDSYQVQFPNTSSTSELALHANESVSIAKSCRTDTDSQQSQRDVSSSFPNSDAQIPIEGRLLIHVGLQENPNDAQQFSQSQFNRSALQEQPFTSSNILYHYDPQMQDDVHAEKSETEVKGYNDVIELDSADCSSDDANRGLSISESKDLGGYSVVTIPESTDLSNPVLCSSEVKESCTFDTTPMIKSSLKKTSPGGVRKAVKFSNSDLVHVEEYTVSPSTPPPDLLFPYDRQLDSISEDSENAFFGDSLFAQDIFQNENGCRGSWFDSSTDADPYLADFPSPCDDRDCAPLSFANDIFGRTTLFVASGAFRPGESGKLYGKTVSDLNGSHDNRRTLSAGTLSGIKSLRTLVRVDFVQGLLDINHNPGQTVEVDSKAAQDAGNIVSSYKYCQSAFGQDKSKKVGIEEFSHEGKFARCVDQKICRKLSYYKYKLLFTTVIVCLLLSLAIGLGVGLSQR